MKPWSPSAQSLLLCTPLIGDEASVRQTAPTPSALTIGTESVNGWLVPPERVLTFPVQLTRDSRLSMRIGIGMGLSRSNHVPGAMPRGRGHGPPLPPRPEDMPPPDAGMQPVRPPGPNDLGLRVEFTPDGGAESRVVYQLPPEDVPGCLQAWLTVDTSLAQPGPVRGELEFVASGPLAGNPGTQVLWGQPSIYEPVSRPHRNVLLIGVDTLRADAVSPCGARPEVTPNLQRFSESATLFKQARSQAPWTLPSFASVITGLMPAKAGATGISRSIPDRTSTLGEMVLPYGYATFTVCSTPWLGNPTSGFQQGMETLAFLVEPTAQIQVARAEEFISDSMHRDWVCFIHIMDPHAPYEPPEQYRKELCDPNYKGDFPSGYEGGDVRLQPSVVSVEEEIRQIRNLYDAEVANVDAAMADLFAFLDENGLTDETLIIFCSDHGEEFYEHDGYGHGFTQYDEVVHVPLVIRGAGFPEGLQLDTSVANTDILPTILRFLEIPQPRELMGLPLQEVVANGDEMSERAVCGEETARQEGNPLVYSLRWPYKCIAGLISKEVVLYDLAADPMETTDVQADHPEQLAGLAKDIATLVRPQQSAFHCLIAINPLEPPHTFTGTLRIPGGIQSVQTYFFGPADSYSITGDSLSFSILTSLDQTAGLDLTQSPGISLPAMPIKHLVIVPSPGASAMEATVLMDGAVEEGRFFPYGTNVPQPSGSASLQLDSFPLAPYLPAPEAQFPTSFFIWGARGSEEIDELHPMDPQTVEQLRALGYLGD